MILTNGWLHIKTKLDHSGFNAQIKELESKINDLKATLQMASEDKTLFSDREIREMEAELEKLTNKLNTLKRKQLELDSKGLNGMKKNLKDVNSSIIGIIKKVGKWALAVFGVRSAYLAIRNAMSILTQYDSQLAADIDYIKWVMAKTLEPVIRSIVDLTYKLLNFIDSVSYSLFKVHLFANKTADDFKNANKSATKLKKTLAGFDEINQLQDNSSETSFTSPSGSVGTKQDGENSILGWIKEHWKEIAVGLGVIVGLFVLISRFTKIKNPFTGLLNGVGKAAQAIAILGGLALVIKSFTDMITAFAESGLSLGEVAGLLGIVLGELTIAFTALAAATKLMDWTGIAAAVVILGGLVLVLNSVTKLIDTFSKSGMKLSDVGILLGIVFGSIIVLMGAIVLLGPAMTAGLVPFSILMAEIYALLAVMAITLPIILDACGNFIEKIAPYVIQLLNTIGDVIERIIYALGTVLPPIVESIGKLFTRIFDGISKVINTVGQSIVNIMNSAKNLITTVLQKILDFINKLGPAINNFVDNVILAVTKLINFIVSGVEYLINTLIVDAINGLLRKVKENKIVELLGMDEKITLLGRVSIERFKPVLLAKGGIIDVPNRGVPLTNNIVAGEAGAEAVIPLTDDTLQRLANMIPITIDLTNTIDGRILNRRLEEVKNRQVFARNGGIV